MAGRGRSVEQSQSGCQPDGFQRIVGFQLFQNALAVGIDRVDADGHLFGDLFAQITVANQLQDLLLARSQGDVGSGGVVYGRRQQADLAGLEIEKLRFDSVKRLLDRRYVEYGQSQPNVSMPVGFQRLFLLDDAHLSAVDVDAVFVEQFVVEDHIFVFEAETQGIGAALHQRQEIVRMDVQVEVAGVFG